MSSEVLSLRSVRASAKILLVASILVSGCSIFGGAKPIEKTESGPMAARRAAQADVEAQVAAGASGLQGTTSTVPSLVPGEGRVSLPAQAAAPATAPAEADFDDDNAGHLLARCRDRAARRQWFDAVGDCRRSAELNPSSVEPQVELMQLLIELQAYADAGQAASNVLAAKPNDPIALYYLAWSYRGREQYPEAIAALQKAVSLEPKRVQFVQALGLTYCLSDNFGKGIATLEQAQALQPSDTKTGEMLKSARAVLDNHLEPYRKLVQEKPDSFDNQAALGFIYQKYGLSQQALTAYDTSLAKMPPLTEQDADAKKISAQIYYNRGVVYRELGRPAEAEPALWQAMQLEPSLAAFAWYYIGLSRYDDGKLEASIDALRKSIDLAPNVADNRAALADAYAKAGKTALAAEQREAADALRARAQAEKDAAGKASANAARAAEKAGEDDANAADGADAALAPEDLGTSATE